MPKLDSPLKENEFYCVKARTKVKGENIRLDFYENKKTGRLVPALRGYSTKYDCNLTKFIPVDKVEQMRKKYGTY